MSIVRVKDDRVIERQVTIKGVPQIFREQRVALWTDQSSIDTQSPLCA